MVYLSGLWAFWGQYNCILISCILGILNTYTVPGFAVIMARLNVFLIRKTVLLTKNSKLKGTEGLLFNHI